MSKLIKINDRKPIEIYIGRKTRGPITGVRLSEAVIGRILRSIDAPKDIYAMGPNNTLVKLTLENYMVPEEDLFDTSKSAPVMNENDTKAKAEALRKSLEAKRAESENKSEDVKSEDVVPVITEENIEINNEPKVQNEEKIVENTEAVNTETTENITVKEEDVVVNEANVEKTNSVAETKQDAPVKNYNNYNKNYNKNYKNKK